MDRMRRFMQQIPGTSPMGTPLVMPSGGWQAEGVVGGPPGMVSCCTRTYASRCLQGLERLAG